MRVVKWLFNAIGVAVCTFLAGRLVGYAIIRIMQRIEEGQESALQSRIWQTAASEKPSDARPEPSS